MANQEDNALEMREEYDFSQGVRNPYAQQFEELNLISLDPDVKAMFPDSDSVNRALRLMMELAARSQELSKAS